MAEVFLMVSLSSNVHECRFLCGSLRGGEGKEEEAWEMRGFLLHSGLQRSKPFNSLAIRS